MYSFISNFLDIVPSNIEFWSGVIGAILGAAISGVVSYCLQYQSLKEQRAAFLNQQTTRYKSVLFSILYKLIRINSNNYHIHKHMENCFSSLEEGGKAEPWTVVVPIPNLPSNITFNEGEMAVILELDRPDIFDALSNVDALYNSLLEGVRLMGEGRNEITKIFDLNMVDKGSASGRIPKDRVNEFRLKSQNINAIILNIKHRSTSEFKFSAEAIAKLNLLLKEKFNFNHTVRVPDIEK